MASIERRPDGRWRARWREYPGGPQRAKHFTRKIDATTWITSVNHDLLTGAYVDPSRARTTLGDFWTSWSPRQPWRASSRASITSLFERHVLPTFGSRPLGSIRRGDIEAWASGLPLAGRTAGQATRYLGTLLEAAVGDGLLATNPARRAKRPRVAVTPVVPFTADEADALREAAPGWFAVALTLGLGAGLRQAEATGLTVDRVDFLRRSLTVDRQLVTPPVSGPPTFGPLKTDRSYRSVPLADAVVEDLARHVERHGTGRDGLVLCLRDGSPIRRQRFGVLWRALRARADLPEARFHTARHTYASVLLSGGVSVAATAEYLGHSPAMLMSTYAHLMPADHDRARGVVQEAFARSTEDRLRTVEGSDDG